MNKLTNKIILAALLVLPSIGLAAPMGYSITTSNNSLYSINLTTGSATNLGTVAGGAAIGGLAAAGSTLYGVTTSNNGNGGSQIYNVSTPPGSLIGDTGARFGNITGAAYRSQDGFIYNLQGDPTLPLGTPRSALYQISPTTAQTSFLGFSPVFADGLAINGSGIGYATDFKVADAFYQVSLNPFSLTFVGSLGLGVGGTGSNSGAAFDPATGFLYALREDGAIFTIATTGPNTGAATFNAFVTDASSGSRVASSLAGLAISGNASAVPEPGSLVLMAAGLALFAFCSRHLRRN